MTTDDQPEHSSDELPHSGHSNWMAGISYDPSNPLVVLRMVAASCFFGEPKYYVDGKQDEKRKTARRHGARITLTDSELEHIRTVLDAANPREWRALTSAQALEKAIDAALDFDADATLQIAAALRNEDLVRTTPQVIMVRAANHEKVRGTSLVRNYAPLILKRGDEPAVQLAYQLAAFPDAKRIPNALTKSWKAFLDQASEYTLAKYRMEGRAAKTIDVINLCHAHSPAIDKLMRGALRLEERTWESLISEKGSTRENWAEALDKFLLNPKGHMALLRNLRNLAESGLVDDKVLDALKAGAKAGKQLPFRYYSAYRNLQGVAESAPGLLPAIESCLASAVGNLPRFRGRVAALCDNSGSAQGAFTSSLGSMKISTIANLTGILTGLNADEGYVGIFGDQLDMIAVDKKTPVLKLLERCESAAKSVGTGTEHGIWLFLDKAIREHQHWDHVFIYSDMQAGHGGLYGNLGNGRHAQKNSYEDFVIRGRYIDVAKLVATYHQKVNPDCMFYMVQMAGYEDTLLPEYYRRSFILGGWSEGVIKFAHAMSALWDKD